MILVKLDKVLGGYTDETFVNPEHVAHAWYITKGNGQYKDKEYTIIRMVNNDQISIERTLPEVAMIFRDAK